MSETAYIVHPVIVSEKRDKARRLDSLLEEAKGLAAAISLRVVDLRVARVAKISPGYFLGKGNRDAIAEDSARMRPDVVIVNHSLTPVQQRNLERAWKAKVIDRTGLILEIFSARAQTKEGRLQVDLAALEYQKSRLVRLWTHLERQRGGAGFMGGPGETQKELDKRIIRDKIFRIKKELEDVRRMRDLGRKARERVPFPVAAIVGYTNAGKSTLFNRITNANVLAKDLLFATLDPTMRRIELAGGQSVILSDTVGFISDLPTHLVAAFRATLEQIAYADVILHVVDVAQEDSAAQRNDVIQILGDLGIEYESDERIIELWNKIDLLDQESREEVLRQAKFKNAVPVSAISGEGIEDLKARISSMVSRNRIRARYKIDISDGKALAWLYQHAHILNRRDYQKSITLDVMIEPSEAEKFRERHGYSHA